MTQRVVVLGATWDAIDILDIVDDISEQEGSPGNPLIVEGYHDLEDNCDEAVQQILRRRRLAYLGDVRFLDTTSSVVSGNDWLAAHRELDILQQVKWLTLIHPTAALGSQIQIGDGCVVGPGASIGTNVRMGPRAWVGANATIGHDTQVNEGVRVGAGVVISGRSVIGSRCVIDVGATVLEGRVIGQGGQVRAGACVTRDVAPAAIVSGVPARTEPSSER